MAQANITSHVRLRNHISGYTDVIQMLTGVLLCCFVLMHMVLVSSVILSPKIMDSLAVFLETSYLAQIGGPIIHDPALYSRRTENAVQPAGTAGVLASGQDDAPYGHMAVAGAGRHRDRHPCHGQRACHQHPVEFAHLRG
mgnify:CR=1 FL=1